jgi:hypothetical protein
MSKERTSNDQRADVKNPNNNDYKQNQDNRSVQIQQNKGSVKK